MGTVDIPQRIHQACIPINESELQSEVQNYINTNYQDLDTLLAQSNDAGPSTVTSVPLKRVDSRRSGKEKRKRGLREDIDHWQSRQTAADAELAETTDLLPKLLETTQDRIQRFLESAQNLSIERYALADKLANLFNELQSRDDSGDNEDMDAEYAVSNGDTHRDKGKTVLEQMEYISGELARLEAGLTWISLIEQVILLSEKTLSPKSHHPSPLAAVPHFQTLHKLVENVQDTLPGDMSLLRIIAEIRDTTWSSLKDVMSRHLLQTCTALQWPLRVEYNSIPSIQRRAFERAYQDLLYLQAEGEALGMISQGSTHWSDGAGLYPLQAMVQPIELRFKYHFQSSRNTNRIDKPEWAFSNILDQLYEHTAFIQEYLQPLTASTGFTDIDVKSEFTMLLFPTLLNMLRSRIPRLLDHPALLAHTIYQTVVFDDSIRDGGFDLSATSIHDPKVPSTWEGLAGVLLRDEGWFTKWLSGEKKFADSQLNEIISAVDAWDIVEDMPEDEGETIEAGLKPTVSARRVKALFEQITDRYSPLPSLEYRMPFLTQIQLPILASYLSRISGSLDAFETLSSAFVRVVPGALTGNTRSGVNFDQAKITGGKAGLDRLLKAYLSAQWVYVALRTWRDDLFFVDMSGDLLNTPQLKWKLQNELLLPAIFRSGMSSLEGESDPSVFDNIVEQFRALHTRSLDMIVRHVSAEVQNELREHLKRLWDRSADDDMAPGSSLVNAIATLSSHLTSIFTSLPPLVVSKIYRRIVGNLSNHIQQRAVYSGWSKFSYQGGRDFADEMKDWKQACLSTLIPDINIIEGGDTGIPGGAAAVLRPWQQLVDIGKVLSLSNDDGAKDGAGVTFSQCMAAAWSDGDESMRVLRERLRIEEMTKAELQGILRRRVDCWR